MAMQRGLDMARQNRFVTVPEAAFMAVNPDGIPYFRSDVGSDGNGLTNPQNWIEHVSDGNNLAEATVLVGEEGLIARNFMPRYRLMERVLRGVCGLPISDTNIDTNTRRKVVWNDPEQGSPAIETETGYYGEPDGSARLLGGKVRSFNIDVRRTQDGGAVSGNIEYHFNRLERGIIVPGAIAANAKYRFAGSKAVGNGTFAVKIGGAAVANVVLTPGMTGAQVKAAFEALAGAPVVLVTGAVSDPTFTVEFTTPANTKVSITKVSGVNWAVSQRSLGAAGSELVYQEGPYLESDHWRVYIATDDADLASINIYDLPDDAGQGGDPHLLLKANAATFSMADLWKLHYSGNTKRFATDFVAGARTVGASILLPNDETEGSDCEFLYRTQEGCVSTGFWLKRVFACGGFEYIEDVYVGRNQAVGYEADNDVWLRNFPLARRRNPQGTGSLRFTLVLPII